MESWSIFTHKARVSTAPIGRFMNNHAATPPAKMVDNTKMRYDYESMLVEMMEIGYWSTF